MATKKRKTVKKSTGRAKNNSKIASIGKKIMTTAKAIRKANPRKKWTTCVSEAGKAYRRSK